MKNYLTEREGQMEFFDNYGIDYINNPVLVDNTDGVYNGNILEFKLNISDLNKVLSQVIKYLSRMRIKGESVPATIILVDLNKELAYIYKSQDYFDEIHQIYQGGASTDNAKFTGKPFIEKLDYSQMVDSQKLKNYLVKTKASKADLYMPIKLDENCIVGWAERYYRENPKAKKSDFLEETGKRGFIKTTGEIRDPKYFKDEILPYTETSNEKFKYLMDCLNDRLSKKNLGAFYTPTPYCDKSAELVMKAIDRVPAGNDYVIIDRCAGTGNLEESLRNLKDKKGDLVLSHCLVSTYEYYEYKVLQERIGADVRAVIPPTEANIKWQNGSIANADATSKEYIENPIIKPYLDDPKCTIILLENPPYRDPIGCNHKETSTSANKSFIYEEMVKILSSLPNSNVSTARDLSNQFIWSGFKYYLRQPTDSYILYSPIKYWKTLGLADKKCIEGYLFNRAHFHASPSAIACILWSNEDDKTTGKLVLKAYDIDENNKLKFEKDVEIKKCKDTFLKLFDKRKINVAGGLLSKSNNSNTKVINIYSESNGYPVSKSQRKCEGISYDSPDIIGYVRPIGFTIGIQTKTLNRIAHFNSRGFYLWKDNYLKKLPLFVAKLFPQENWYENDVYFTTSDGGTKYESDKDFLKSCMIMTCLTTENKCLSFNINGLSYQNELCFDDNTQAKNDLANMKLGKDEQELIDLWQKILDEAKTTANYNSAFKYGTYQIDNELNTTQETTDQYGKKIITYDYPQLNGNIKLLKEKLKAYYNSHIKAKMFQYELVK